MNEFKSKLLNDILESECKRINNPDAFEEQRNEFLNDILGRLEENE
jgi:hypothetical protein